MGQQYLSGALMNHLEGLHVQSFDLPTILGDSTKVECTFSGFHRLTDNAIVTGSYRSSALY